MKGGRYDIRSEILIRIRRVLHGQIQPLTRGGLLPNLLFSVVTIIKRTWVYHSIITVNLLICAHSDLTRVLMDDGRYERHSTGMGEGAIATPTTPLRIRHWSC